MPFSLFWILNGRRGRGVVSVVPQGLRRAAVACGTGPAGRSYGMDAAFMSFQQHGSGNHAVPVRCWRGGWGQECVSGGAVATGEARADQDQLKLTGNTLWMVLSWLMSYFASRDAPIRGRTAKRHC